MIKSASMPALLSDHPQNDNEYHSLLINMLIRNQADEDDLRLQLNAMFQSEERKYQYTDYLGNLQRHLESCCSTTTSEDYQISNVAVNMECREKMVDWCFQFVDCAGFSRDVVFPAFFYLDQYLQTSVGSSVLLDRDRYRLATLCCFFIATKLMDRNTNNSMDLKTMRDVSQGQYNEEDFCEMELSILSALDWRVHPPCPLEFLPRFLAIASKNIPSNISSSIWQLAHLHCQVAIRNYTSVMMKPSELALTSIIHALNLVNIPIQIKESIESTILQFKERKVVSQNSKMNPTLSLDTYAVCLSPTTVLSNQVQ